MQSIKFNPVGDTDDIKDVVWDNLVLATKTHNFDLVIYIC